MGDLIDIETGNYGNHNVNEHSYFIENFGNQIAFFFKSWSKVGPEVKFHDAIIFND